MKTIKAFVKSHPLLNYFVLAFVISWGGILIVASGPGGISVNSQPSEMLMPLMLLAMFAGPAVAGILLTGLVYGREGFRDLLTRMTRWRVGARWYAVALLTVPLLVTTVLLALSLRSPEFLPGILTTSDKAAFLLSGIVAGLIVGIFEEIGWTGFAIPRLLARHGVLATGIIVGVLWGAWHFLVFFWGGATSSGTLPLALYLFVLLFSILPAYRVLMVWVYDRTESLLVAILMHASLVASQFIIVPLSLVGMATVTLDLVFTAVLWAVVGAVALLNHGHLTREPLRRRVAQERCSTRRIKRELGHRREEVKEMAVNEMRNLTSTPTVGKGEKMSTLTTTTTRRAVEAFRGLKGYRFLNLTTFRKNGVPVVSTVLLALVGDKIYVWTAKDSGKVKRIRNNAKVQIAPSTRLGRPLGPIATASAMILSVTEQTEAQIVTDRQFGWLKQYFALVWRLQGREQIYLEITPTEE